MQGSDYISRAVSSFGTWASLSQSKSETILVLLVSAADQDLLCLQSGIYRTEYQEAEQHQQQCFRFLGYGVGNLVMECE